MKKQLHLLAFISLLSSFQLLAQPANDNLADFIEVTTLPYSHNITASESNSATIEIDEVTCGINRTWWYRYIATEEQFIQFEAQMNSATTGNITNEVRIGFYMDLDNDTAHPLQKIDCRDNNNGMGFGEAETMVFEANTTYYIQVSTSNLVNAQSDISFRMIELAVPVELVYFKGKTVEGGVELSWQTASELNNEGFFVQHSVDAKQWENLTFIEGKGTTIEAQQYHFSDERPLMSSNYYRLKQVDYDQQSEYSKIITVHQQKVDQPVVFPNPTSGDLTIEFPSDKIERIWISNGLGQIIFDATGENNQLNISRLPSAIYWLSIQTTRGKYGQFIQVK
ncbi:MAG: T9SS type A sorting domain-containing protein [Bacteroidota bacterium]